MAGAGCLQGEPLWLDVGLHCRGKAPPPRGGRVRWEEPPGWSVSGPPSAGPCHCAEVPGRESLLFPNTGLCSTQFSNRLFPLKVHQTPFQDTPKCNLFL